MGSRVLAGAAAAMLGVMAGGQARADCVIVGDSIGVGLGHAMQDKCQTVAEIGILSSVVASRVTAGDRWTIVSLGSNDFPAGITSELRQLSEARVRRALAQVLDVVGRRLILVLPANAARATVQDWALAEGIATVGFEPGPDGVHPRSGAYAAMAQQINGKMTD